MSTNQPVWAFVDNLGDADPATYGAFIVYRDTTGVYPPEVEVYEADDDETGGTMSRFIIKRDPTREWWYGKLADVATSTGQDLQALKDDLASDDVIRKASAYQCITSHFGLFEFDQYPVRLTEVEAQARYADAKRLARESRQAR